MKNKEGKCLGTGGRKVWEGKGKINKKNPKGLIGKRLKMNI